MKTMNRYIKILLVAAVGLCFVGCYNDYGKPEPAKVYTREDFGDRIISVKEFKQLFYDEYGNGASSLAKTLPIYDDYVICGKVISSDRAGNVYKSLYIYDETCESAIELRLMVSNYVFYHPGQTIFVKTQGLAIGSYRYMLSVGLPPSDADIENGYANANLESAVTVEEHIFPGELGKLTAADTLVVTPQNYKSVLNDGVTGRLVRFEGLTYKQGTYDGDLYPNYLESVYLNGSSEPTYTTKYYKDQLIPGTDKQMPDTWAYNYSNKKYYGSSWFTYGETTTGTSGNYIARVSGYANFSLNPLPEDGAVGSITAIYTKYSAKNGNYVKYQLLINKNDDIKF